MPKVRNVRAKEIVDPRPKRVSLLEVRREEVSPDSAGREARAQLIAPVAEQTTLGLSLSRLQPGGPVHVKALSEPIAQSPVSVATENAAPKLLRQPRNGTASSPRSKAARLVQLEAECAHLRAELDAERARRREIEQQSRLAVAEAENRSRRAAEEAAAFEARLEVLMANIEVREHELRRVTQMEIESRLEVASEEGMLRDALDEVARLQNAMAEQQDRMEPLRDEAATAKQRIAEALAYAERLEMRVFQLEQALAQAQSTADEPWQIEPAVRPRRRLFRLHRSSITAARGLGRMHSAWPLRMIWRVLKNRLVRMLNPPKPAPRRKTSPTPETPAVLARVKARKRR